MKDKIKKSSKASIEWFFGMAAIVGIIWIIIAGWFFYAIGILVLAFVIWVGVDLAKGHAVETRKRGNDALAKAEQVLIDPDFHNVPVIKDRVKSQSESLKEVLNNHSETKLWNIWNSTSEIASSTSNLNLEIQQAYYAVEKIDEGKRQERLAQLAKAVQAERQLEQNKQQERLAQEAKAKQAERRTEQGAEKHIRSLSPRSFERLIADLLKLEGWDAYLTSPGADSGVDIRAEKRGVFLIVQCKRYAKGNTVGAPAIRDLAGAQARYPDARAIFATTSSFSKPAILEAKSHRYLRLWNMGSIKMRYQRNIDKL